MATNHDVALNTLLNVGLRQRELENILASNCVLDWFGRTVAGRAKVVNYYLNSNNQYEHSMANAETIDAFEERLTHMATRCQPADNQRQSPELFGNEVWYDCQTHTPVDLKETLKTPPRQSSALLQCPGAPCRQNLLQHIDSDDDNEHDSDSDDIEEGIQPLDDTFELIKSETRKSNCKRQRRDKEVKETIAMPESISDEQSKYSSLQYVEVSGSVTIRRQAAAASSSSRDDLDRRECKMQISYRVHKDDANNVQIALIVYKNCSNAKSRRNLMMEFDESVDESLLATSVSIMPSSRSQTTIKEQEDNIASLISTAPAAVQKNARASKRPFTSRNRLRF